MNDDALRKLILEDEVSEKTCFAMQEAFEFFPFLERRDLADMPGYFECRQYGEDEEVCREGDPCEFVGFIVSGRLEIKKDTEFRGKKFILGIYSAGSMIGELCIVDGHPRPYTAVALEESTLVTMSRESFEKVLVEQPELAVRFLRGLLQSTSIRLRKSFDRLATLF